MKPKLVHNWPNVKDDNDIIAQRIKNAIDEYRRKKEDEQHGTHHEAEVSEFKSEEKNNNSKDDKYAQERENLFKGMTVKK